MRKTIQKLTALLLALCLALGLLGCGGGAPTEQPTEQPTETPDAPSALRDGLAKCKNAKERAAYVTAHAREFAAETLN